MERPRPKSNAYLRYSGLGFQMAATIGLGIWIGRKVDEYLGLQQPWLTMLLVMLLFIGFIYKLYVDLTRKE
jgi:ATP synthase protein I